MASLAGGNESLVDCIGQYVSHHATKYNGLTILSDVSFSVGSAGLLKGEGDSGSATYMRAHLG